MNGMAEVTRNSSRTGRRKGGRGHGDSGTRAAILEAARRQFTEVGYGAASLRAIAAEAGVTPPLIMHFFGSKANLLVEAVQWPFDPKSVLPQVIGGDRRGVGERMARLFAETWDDQPQGGTLIGLLRSAATDPKSAALLREFLVSELFAPVVKTLGQSNGDLRACLMASYLLGTVLVRHVLQIEPLASMSKDEVIALMAPTIQRLLTGKLPTT
jgi:AcrR family transcriptional regulator